MSGIMDELEAWDTAVPVNRDGSYPYDGQAITAYFLDRKVAVIPLSDLARRAIKRGHGGDLMLEIAGIKAPS